MIRNVCVYCGSGPGANPAFMTAATTFGRILAENKIGLVYGGGSVGLMGGVSRAVLEHGGKVTGIIPEFLQAREQPLEGEYELVVTQNMHERKQIMFDRADAFVALPGGIGTLEELVEQLTWAQLGQHKKPILIADIDGFWEPLMKLVTHMRDMAFIRAGLSVNLLTASRIEDVLPALQAAMPQDPQTDANKVVKKL